MAGIDDVTPHIEIEGADEAVAKLLEVGAAGESAFTQVADAAAKVGNASAGFEKLTAQGGKALKDLAVIAAEAFSKIIDAAASGNFGPLIGMFSRTGQAIAETTEKVIGFVEAQASMVETLSNLAAATGMSLGQIEGLKDAFASVGISASGFERAIGRLAITITNEWSGIQQSVRTSSDAVAGAQLAVAESAFHVQKAYHSMSQAITEASQSAAHNILHVEEASHGLRSAIMDLADFSLKTQQNTMSIESAQLSLTRARMNLAKDSGFAPSAQDEKAMKLAQDRLAVQEAELRLEEAGKKKQKEGLELEELQLKVKKAKQEAIDADNKKIEDSIKNSDRLKEAEFAIQKAKLAQRETAEKQHEVDLKNIPQIAKDIDQVAGGYKKWDDVANHAEISVQNLQKAVVLAASGGDMSKPPEAMKVFEKMVEIFPQISDQGTKLALVQHTMGAGFRAGQASAAQLMAVLNRGKQDLQEFMEQSEKFSKVKLGGMDLSGAEESLKAFNSEFARLDATFDQVKNRFAGILAGPLAEAFKTLRESIQNEDGALRKMFDAAATGIKNLVEFFKDLGTKSMPALNGIGTAISAVVDAFKAVWSAAKPFIELVMSPLTDVISNFFNLENVIKAIGTAFNLVAVAARVVEGAIGGIIQVVGKLISAAQYLPKLLGGGAGGAADELGKKIEAMGKSIVDNANKGIEDPLKQIYKNITGGESDKDASKGGDAAAIKAGAADIKTGAADIKAAGQQQKTTVEQQVNKLGARSDDENYGIKSESTRETGEAAGKQSSAADKLNTAGQTLQTAAAALLSAAGQGGQTGQAAEGGMIRGPGGPTDDRAGLYALSDGEYVVRSQAVSHYGSSLFEALNSLAVGGFAAGGVVGGARAASVPGGSQSGPSSVLNLTIDGQHFNGLKAPEHVAAKLKTYAVGRQTSSAGRMPSWIR